MKASRSVAVKIICDTDRLETQPTVTTVIMDGGKYLTMAWDDRSNCPSEEDATKIGTEPQGEDPYCFGGLKWDVVYFVLVYADEYAPRAVRIDQKVDIPLLTIHLRKLR